MTADLLFQVQQLHARVAHLLDEGRFDEWPECFSEDGVYVVQSRENHARGLPLALIHLEGRAMLKDRVFGATDTIYHHPYSQRHLIGTPLLLGHDGSTLHVDTPYLVLRTPRDRLPEVLSVGRYVDRLVHDGSRWRIGSRHCLYDNDLVPNSLIYPI